MKHSKLLTIVLALLIAVVLLSASIAAPILCRPFYYAHIDALELVQRTGFTREEIKAKNDDLNLGLIRDDSVLDYNDLPDPIESAEEAVANLEEAVDLLMSVIRELKSLEA